MKKDWKRHEEAKRLRDSGMTLKAVGAVLGVGAERVRNMLGDIERRDRVLATNPWWAGLEPRTVNALLSRGIDSCEACAPLAANDLKFDLGSVWFKLPDGRREYLSLLQINAVRAWLGVAPYVPPDRSIGLKERMERARRLLERNGYRVAPPEDQPE
jgi:hypothetical protein